MDVETIKKPKEFLKEFLDEYLSDGFGAKTKREIDILLMSLLMKYAGLAITPLGLSCEDLALDLLVFPDGSCRVLDEDEFGALSLNLAEQERARLALEELQRMARGREGPFARSSPGAG